MGLRRNIQKDTVADLDLRPVITVGRKTTVREAAARMAQMRLGCVIVVDSKGKPVGKFTERKLMRALVEGPANLDQSVERLMYPSADTVALNEPLAAVIRTMQARGLRFLCVVDGQGKAVALAGQKGLVEYIADHFPRRVKVQLMDATVFSDQREGA